MVWIRASPGRHGPPLQCPGATADLGSSLPNSGAAEAHQSFCRQAGEQDSPSRTRHSARWGAEARVRGRDTSPCPAVRSHPSLTLGKQPASEGSIPCRSAGSLRYHSEVHQPAAASLYRFSVRPKVPSGFKLLWKIRKLVRQGRKKLRPAAIATRSSTVAAWNRSPWDRSMGLFRRPILNERRQFLEAGVKQPEPGVICSPDCSSTGARNGELSRCSARRRIPSGRRI